MALNAINLSAGANAISQGLDSYLKAKQMKDQRDYQQQSLNLNAAQGGLIQDPNNQGGYLPGPLAQAKQAEAMQDYSKAGPLHDTYYKAANDQAHRIDKKASDLPQDLSNKELKDYMSTTKPQQTAVISLDKIAAGTGKADKNSWKDYSKRLDSDKVYQKALSGEAEVNNSMAALDQASGGNPMAGNSIPIVLARLATGGQRLNQTEIQMLGGSKAVGARLSAAIEQAKTGNMTPENINFAKQVVQASARADAANKESAILRHATRAANEQNVDVDDAYERISGFPREQKGLVQNGLVGGGAPQAAAPAGPQAPKVGEIQEGHRYKGGNPASPNSWEPL